VVLVAAESHRTGANLSLTAKARRSQRGTARRTAPEKIRDGKTQGIPQTAVSPPLKPGGQSGDLWNFLQPCERSFLPGVPHRTFVSIESMSSRSKF
jgi:hypothetical protein